MAAMQSLVGGDFGRWLGLAVVTILLICLTALVMGSSYGIFFGVEIHRLRHQRIPGCAGSETGSMRITCNRSQRVRLSRPAGGDIQ
ncbi:MAG: hypothetical protein ACLU9S_08080 [Oscillospiraceae bacterium]